MKPLQGIIALVTGASRGVGKGIALGLGEAGATVYLTARTEDAAQARVALPGTIGQTAAEVDALGGRAIALACDHTDDEQTRCVFARIQREHGGLDVLVNNVWGGYEFFNDGTKFWEEKGFWTAPLSRWDLSFNAGVRAHYVCSVLAAPMMIARGRGLIVNISALAAHRDDFGVAYGVSKSADVRMIQCMHHELAGRGVACVALYPGLVRTESVLKAGKFFDLSNSESPQFSGRVVAALARDPDVMSKAGRWHIVAELAQEYGIVDIDGRQPKSRRDEIPAAAS